MAAPVDLAVGIDVAKAQVDIAVEPTGATWTVPRTRGGLRRLRADLRALQPTRIVLEATGGYERRVRGRPGRPAGGRGQSAPDPPLRARPRPPRQDRSAGRAGARTVRGRCAAPGAPRALEGGAGAAAPQPAPAPTGEDAGDRAATAPPPDPRAAGRQRRLPGPGHAPDPRPGPGPGRGPAGGSGPAGAGHLAAQYPRHRPRRLCHLAGRGARTRHLHPPAGRRPGRRRALQPRQRRLARAPPRLGWAAARSGRCCTWPPSPRSGPIPASAPAISGCTPPASRPRWP